MTAQNAASAPLSEVRADLHERLLSLAAEIARVRERDVDDVLEDLGRTIVLFTPALQSEAISSLEDVWWST